MTTPLLEEINSLHADLEKANNTINILRTAEEEQYQHIDKLERQVNKDSTNSGIPTSKEITSKHKKQVLTYIITEKTIIEIKLKR